MGVKKNPVPRTPLPAREGVAQQYVSAEEAAKSLGIKVASLYAYVSRGLVRSIVQPGLRERLYYREDIERAGKRMGARAGSPGTVESVLNWGQPVFQTALTDLAEDGPLYRGRPAIALAESGRSFEAVAELLWTGMDLPQLRAWETGAPPARLGERLSAAIRGGEALSCLRLMALTTTIVAITGHSRPDFERGSTIADARQLIVLYCGALGLMGPSRKFLAAPPEGMPLAELFLRALSVRPSRDAIRAVNLALILCADHELSPGTLSARIAASCASELRACLLSAIGAHAGLFLAGGCDESEALLRAARDAGEMHALMSGIERSGGRIPGYNLRAYPKGDPRARKLLETAASLGPRGRRVQLLVASVEKKFDLQPSLETGLVALVAALDLPPRTASALWAIGRSAGWVAHVIEQRQAGFMVRPRARYTGSTAP